MGKKKGAAVLEGIWLAYLVRFATDIVEPGGDESETGSLPCAPPLSAAAEAPKAEKC